MKYGTTEYRLIHLWINKKKPRKGICDNCGAKGKTGYSNKSGEYNKNVDDWQELCDKCHYKYDKEVLGANKSPAGTFRNKELASKAGSIGGSISKRGNAPRNDSRIAVYNGKKYYYSELARELGVNRQTIFYYSKAKKNKYGIVFI